MCWRRSRLGIIEPGATGQRGVANTVRDRRDEYDRKETATHETCGIAKTEGISMMKSNAGQPKTPESKPKANDAAQNRLTEDGPNGGKNKKVNPFRKFLNNLWGPIRG